MSEELTFGGRIKALRKAKGLSQKVLARQSGCSESYVSRIEKGQMVPNEELVINFAKTLEVDDRLLLLLAQKEKAPGAAKEIFSLLESSLPFTTSKGSEHNGFRMTPVLEPLDLTAWSREDMKVPALKNLRHIFFPSTTRDSDAFFLLARGKKLCGGRIEEGDRLLVEPNAKPKSGDLVLVKGKRGPSLARLFSADKEKNVEILIPLSDNDEPTLVEEEAERPVLLKIAQVNFDV